MIESSRQSNNNSSDTCNWASIYFENTANYLQNDSEILTLKSKFNERFLQVKSCNNSDIPILSEIDFYIQFSTEHLLVGGPISFKSRPVPLKSLFLEKRQRDVHLIKWQMWLKPVSRATIKLEIYTFVLHDNC